MRFHVKQAGLWLALLVSVPLAAAERVVVPGDGVELVGLLYRPEGTGPFPAVVLLHGCSGMWARESRPNRSYAHWAEQLRRRGYIAVLLDSFGPRGEREVCSQRDRSIRADRERSRDAHAALRWLAGRAEVEAHSVHLLGWSNGAMTVLHAIKPEAPGRTAKAAAVPVGRRFLPWLPPTARHLPPRRAAAHPGGPGGRLDAGRALRSSRREGPRYGR